MKSSEPSENSRKISEDEDKILVTKKLASEIKNWHALGAALKMTTHNKALLDLISHEKKAQRSLDWENVNAFLASYKSDSTDPSIYKEQNLLYAAAALKAEQITHDEFSDLVFRTEMADACGANNVQTFLLIDASGELTAAGKEFFKSLESGFKYYVDPLNNLNEGIHPHFYYDFYNEQTRLKSLGVPEGDELDARLTAFAHEYRELQYSIINRWMTDLKSALIKLYQISPSLCVAHRIEEQAYEAQKLDKNAILKHIGYTESSPGMVTSDRISSLSQNGDPDASDQAAAGPSDVDVDSGNRWFMSIGLIQEWGKIIGNGGYSLRGTLGELDLEELEKMDLEHIHPLAISYADTWKMFSADSFTTTRFSATLHDIYHFLDKSRLSPQLQNVLQHVKDFLNHATNTPHGQFIEESWRCVDKNILVPLLQPCVEQREFLTFLSNKFTLEITLLVLMEALNHPQIWQANNINPDAMVRAYYETLMEKEDADKDINKFPWKILGDTLKRYLDGDEQMRGIIFNNDPFPVKFIKLIYASYGASDAELASLNVLLEEKGLEQFISFEGDPNSVNVSALKSTKLAIASPDSEKKIMLLQDLMMYTDDTYSDAENLELVHRYFQTAANLVNKPSNIHTSNNLFSAASQHVNNNNLPGLNQCAPKK